MMSMQRWMGDQAQVDGGGGQLHVDVHTENKSSLMLSCSLLMQRSWFILYHNFIFGRNKTLKFFVNIN